MENQKTANTNISESNTIAGVIDGVTTNIEIDNLDNGIN